MGRKKLKKNLKTPRKSDISPPHLPCLSSLPASLPLLLITHISLVFLSSFSKKANIMYLFC
jgi:hypothetical protein